jgi:hypothetical protein
MELQQVLLVDYYWCVTVGSSWSLSLFAFAFIVAIPLCSELVPVLQSVGAASLPIWNSCCVFDSQGKKEREVRAIAVVKVVDGA